MDHFDRTNIIKTPFRQNAVVSQDDAELYPLESYPFHGQDAERNPFLLKRKLKMGGTERTILFSPPDSEYAFTLDFPENCELEFGMGIQYEESSAKNSQSEKRGVSFIVSMEMRGREKTIFQQYLQAPHSQDEVFFVFERHSLDLPYTGEGARFTFRVEGDKGLRSFWANPVLFPKGRTGRNVILISVDTLRADHLGCYGYERDTSPNIDALAADSALFYNTYASSPWTLPSHVSLLTARNGVHHQVYHDDESMDPDMMTLAEAFASEQYACAAFTGGGFVSPVYGFSQGFDTYDVGVGGVFHQDSAERVFQAASKWIDRHVERDFFLFLHTYQVHSPYACPPPYKVMYLNDESLFGNVDLIHHLGGKDSLYREIPELERQNIIDLYDGEIRYTDEKLVGPLLSKLKEMDLYDRTLVVFISDHGEEFFDHGGWGHGHSLYDESLKVPLIVKFPNSSFRAKKCDNVVSLVDLMPTIMEVMGLKLPEEELDGQSLIPLLAGDEREDRTFLADVGSNVMGFHIPQKIATNRGREKLILSQRFNPEDLDFFTHPPPQIGPVELYDLLDDPLEQYNLADQKPQFSAQLIRWINDYYVQAKKSQVSKIQIDESVKEQLKALGYIK